MVPITILLLLLAPTLHALHGSYPNPYSGRRNDKGINCKGSSQCSFTTVNSPNILREFNSTLWIAHGTRPDALPRLPGSRPVPPKTNLDNNPLPDYELFFKGEHIICARNLHWLVGSICVFLQGDNVPVTGVPGFVIKRLVYDLVYHNCKFCGSVPVSGDNEPETSGVLTSNYVMDEGCHGVCVQSRKRMFLLDATERQKWFEAAQRGVVPP
ncbi:MAG: hypothetical protein Q9169_003627 [Polycauliona sp. 2 TL-2023]